ncbi:MAG: hypothetical protein ACK4E0_18655 [Chitinophagaceae bacterium]
MKKLLFRSSLLLLTLALLAVSLSSYMSMRVADDFWKILGISETAGSNQIRNSFMNGYLQHYGVRNLKNIASADRVRVAEDLLNYTKQYVNSAEFKQQYEKTREQAKPVAPEKKPLRSLKEIQKEEIANTEKSIKSTEKTMKELGGQMAKDLQPLLDQLKQTLKAYQDSNHQNFQYVKMGEKLQQEDADRRFKEDTERWNKQYPANIQTFIADKLQRMLDATKGIDYQATLVEKYGKMRFTNPSYESKSREWKMGYRAGKEVTEKARAFVKQWQGELVNR